MWTPNACFDLHPFFNTLSQGGVYLPKNSFLQSLFNWQTLFGAIIGAIMPLVVVYFDRKWKAKEDRKKQEEEKQLHLKESIRRIEISLTMSLTDIGIISDQLKILSKRLWALINEIEKEVDPKAYRIDRVNFPLFDNVYRDSEIVMFKTGSLYLHNKLLICDNRLKIFNYTIKDLKKDFEDLIDANIRNVSLMDPVSQRNGYLVNLKSFVRMIDEYEKLQIPILLKILVQAKVYNQKLGEDQIGTILKFEGNSKDVDMSKYSQIDELLKSEVDSMIQIARSHPQLRPMDDIDKV